MPILSAPVPIVRPRFSPPEESWQEAIKRAVRDPVELCRLLELSDEIAAQASRAGQGFPLFVPRGFLRRMSKGDLTDPLLRQVLPLGDELADLPGFVRDPVDDQQAIRQPGLLQKYDGRALLVLTGACAIHCRYCFRRHFPYGDSPNSLREWQPSIESIARDEQIAEVILSGGDPLMLVDDVLGELVARLAEVTHVKRLRVHTRLPIVIPQRVTDELIRLLRGSRLAPIVVVHANHANEIDDHVAHSLSRLVDAGIVVLNQAVLLRGVNDTIESQADLCERLVNLRVLPYYLHQLDRVAGASHFEVPPEIGLRIIGALRARLPGYAVPRYVQEVAGAPSKIEII